MRNRTFAACALLFSTAALAQTGTQTQTSTNSRSTGQTTANGTSTTTTTTQSDPVFHTSSSTTRTQSSSSSTSSSGGSSTSSSVTMPVGPIPRGGANVDFGKMGNLNVGYGSAAAPDRDDDDDWDSDFGGSQPPASKRGDGLILYRDVNFQSPSITIRFDEPDLAWRQFADAASSARVIAGTWELCENARFGGHCIKLKRDMPIFITVPDFNDVASSARRIDVPGEQRPGLALYEDTQFGGRSILIEQNTPDLGVVEFGKLASSLEVVGGAWLVCQEPHYRGRCQKITRDASDLIAVDWNDTIASVRRIR